MNTTDLKPGARYVVRKVRKLGSLRVGDWIKLETNGDLSCVQAQGWIEREHVAEELAKVEADIEKDSLRLESAALEKRMAEIKEALK